VISSGVPDLALLSARIGYTFRDESMLRQALAHRSWCAEHMGEPSNERLEFLGDAVLGWIIADLVYRRHHDLAEGKLTDLRKALVNAVALAEVATEIGLGDQVLLGKGETMAGGSSKPSILSDAFEAVLGSVYLDGGPEEARALVLRLLEPRLEIALRELGGLDRKTLLQELAARIDSSAAPSYVVRDTGPDHAKTFTAEVLVQGEVLGRGVGRSKKQAEQAAASEACEALQVRLSAGAAAVDR
jgi:ribonuclease III